MFSYADGMRAYEVKKPFEGVIRNLERRYLETESDWAREEISRYMSAQPCAACTGFRLKPEALAVKIDHRHIGEISELSVRDAALGSRPCRRNLTPRRQEIAARILREIDDRLKFLVDVGLDYLTLSRGSGTLSGGESQRIRLASQIGSGLTGVLYVLDEPSIGLHQRDNARLLDTLRRLRDLGNSVIVVEHDEDAILAADYVVDVGPGAGVHGGEIVAQGTPADIMADENSLTGAYLTGRLQVAAPKKRRKPDAGRKLLLTGARGNNLQNVDGGYPARPVHLHHRRLGRRQIDPDRRYALQGGGAAAQRRAGAPGALRQARRPGAYRQGHRHRPVAHRPHAALQSRDLYRRLHAHSRLVRRLARGQGARLWAGPFLVQRQGRALRGLPGRRRDQDRNALSARRLRHLRRVQGQALRPRDPGGALSRTRASPTCST